MNHELFNLDEKNKINLSDFIKNLFIEYDTLYSVEFFLHQTSLFEKGKIKDSKISLKLSITFKYNSFYCLWFNGGAHTYENDDDKKLDLENNNIYINGLLNNYKPINFYLKNDNKKITYSDFESSILKKEELTENKINSVFGEKQNIIFCKKQLNDDLAEFLGFAIISKQNAIKLEQELPYKPLKQKTIKI